MVTPRVRLSRRAKRDLDSLWDHIAGDDLAAADRVVERLRTAFEQLAVMPLMGRARPELGARYRSFPVERAVIFYRPARSGIEILRVTYGGRDVEQLF